MMRREEIIYMNTISGVIWLWNGSKLFTPGKLFTCFNQVDINVNLKHGYLVRIGTL